MGKLVGIRGDTQRIQSSVDFYLKITSIKDISSVEQLRKFCYDKFMEEEESRAAYNRESSGSENLEVENNIYTDVKDKEYLKEDELENENSFLSEEELNQKIKNIIEDEKILDAQKIANIKYYESGVMLDDEEETPKIGSDSVKTNIEEEIEYVSEGVCLDEEVLTISTDSVKNSAEEEIECATKGKDLDDYNCEESMVVQSENSVSSSPRIISIEISDKEDEVDDTNEEIEYVSEGIVLEDIISLDDEVEEVEDKEVSSVSISLDIDEPTVKSDTTEYNEVSQENNTVPRKESVGSTSEDIENLKDDIFSLFGISDEELENIKTPSTSKMDKVVSYKEDDKSVKETENTKISSVNKVERSTENVKFIKETEEDFFESVLDSNKDYMMDESESNKATNKKHRAEKKEPVTSVEKRIIDVPGDIRDFLRAHPNASIEFVSEYYPMKEINKQIQIGRIFSKKGKLMI